MPLSFVYYHLPTAVFVFCFGACVGSFLNVVVYRLPAGMSVITPPSRCPTCGARLSFFRDNLPILGWLLLRGRCRYCRDRISPQYMIIELLLALSFVGMYVVIFTVHPSVGFWGELGGPWWYFNGVWRVWPAFVALVFLIAGLIAMTLVDARTFTIPIQIPLFVTVTAFIAWPLQALLPRMTTPAQAWPIPTVGWTGFMIAVGGMAGVVLATILLRSGRIRYSFSDYDEYVKEGEALGDYPHGRREMFVEFVFLGPILVGMIAGGLLSRLAPTTAPPEVLQATGGSFLGYLVGGGLIWGIRILGTFAFGREAMGLGDVHLLASVGAVLGWFDPIPIFFIAPFSGLAWVVLTMCLGSVFKNVRRELPYGPHLAVATLVVILGRPMVTGAWNSLFGPAVPWPVPGFQQPAPAPPPVMPGPGTPAPPGPSNQP